MKTPIPKTSNKISTLVGLLWLAALPALATDAVFDLTTFCCPCSPDDHFCQAQFDPINWATNANFPNGHYCMFSTDAHRLDCNTNGNDIAQYYNTLNTGWTTTSALDRAQQIDDAAVANMTGTGPKPVWVALNEISGGTWPGNATYRQWLIDVCHYLRVNHGRNVVVYSPFANPAANDASWQALSAEAWICSEIYLSGQAIKANGFSQTWCQTQYQNSFNTYLARGVPASKIMMVEHYAQTIDDGTTTWGRTSVTSNEWRTCIQVRTRAFLSIPFAGYHSYAWGKNAMLVTDAELIGHAQTYAAEMGAGFAPPPPPPTTNVHVQSITMSWVKTGRKYKALADVQVVDAGGAAISGATVTGDFSGSISNPGLSGVTGSTGDATILSTSAITTGTVTFTVTNITGANLNYDSAANVVTSATESR